MLSVRACLSFLLLTALAASPGFASRTHRAPAPAHHHHHKLFAKKARHHFVPGQRGIDSGRATEIQAALIQKHYLSGAPSGQWDAETEAAMQKYQADHGWQTRLTPDSRALISLGLGPDHAADATGTAVAPSSAATPPPAPNTLASTHVIPN